MSKDAAVLTRLGSLCDVTKILTNTIVGKTGIMILKSKQILIECSSFDLKFVPSFRNIVTRFTNTGSRGAASPECLLKPLRISVFQGNVLQPTTIGSNFVLQNYIFMRRRETGNMILKLKQTLIECLLF